MSSGIVICEIPSITHYTLGGGTYFEIWINVCWLCVVPNVTSGTLLDSPSNCTFFLIYIEKSMVMVVGLRTFILKESKVPFVVRLFVCCNIMRTQHYLWFLFSQLLVSLLNICIYYNFRNSNPKFVSFKNEKKIKNVLLVCYSVIAIFSQQQLNNKTISFYRDSSKWNCIHFIMINIIVWSEWYKMWCNLRMKKKEFFFFENNFIFKLLYLYLPLLVGGNS